MSRLRMLTITAGLLLVALVPLALPVRAINELVTQVSIRPLEPVSVGVYLRATVDLTLANGSPVPDQPVTLFMNGAPVHRTRTDANGVALFNLGEFLAPGEYDLVAIYDGATDAYFGSTGSSTLVILPYELTVETVPPLPGMAFELDGTSFVAGEDGVARIQVTSGGEHELAVIEQAYHDPEKRPEFSRWNSESFGPRITIRVPGNVPLQAGFDLFYRASQSFVDLDGNEVDPSRVTSLTLQSSLGTVYTLTDGRERWYKASRAVRRPTGVESVDVTYNIQAVEVDGSNVVNSGQQRFLVQSHGAWEIELLLFAARITARDALFGFPIAQAVEVIYPNGTVVKVEPDENGELSARWLARGNYRMTVADAPGWAPVMPVALSQDQEVELRVISYLDIAVGALAPLALALGLLHIGRPHVLPGTVTGARQGFGTLARQSGAVASRVAVGSRGAIASGQAVASRLAVASRPRTQTAPDARFLPVIVARPEPAGTAPTWPAKPRREPSQATVVPAAVPAAAPTGKPPSEKPSRTTSPAPTVAQQTATMAVATATKPANRPVKKGSAPATPTPVASAGTTAKKSAAKTRAAVRRAARLAAKAAAPTAPRAVRTAAAKANGKPAASGPGLLTVKEPRKGKGPMKGKGPEKVKQPMKGKEPSRGTAPTKARKARKATPKPPPDAASASASPQQDPARRSQDGASQGRTS